MHSQTIEWIQSLTLINPFRKNTFKRSHNFSQWKQPWILIVWAVLKSEHLGNVNTHVYINWHTLFIRIISNYTLLNIKHHCLSSYCWHMDVYKAICCVTDVPFTVSTPDSRDSVSITFNNYNCCVLLLSMFNVH